MGSKTKSKDQEVNIWLCTEPGVSDICMFTSLYLPNLFLGVRRHTANNNLPVASSALPFCSLTNVENPETQAATPLDPNTSLHGGTLKSYLYVGTLDKNVLLHVSTNHSAPACSRRSLMGNWGLVGFINNHSLLIQLLHSIVLHRIWPSSSHVEYF